VCPFSGMCPVAFAEMRGIVLEDILPSRTPTKEIRIFDTQVISGETFELEDNFMNSELMVHHQLDIQLSYVHFYLS